MSTLANIIPPFGKKRREELQKVYDDSYAEHYAAMKLCSPLDQKRMDISIMKMEVHAWAGSREDRKSIKGARDAYNDFMSSQDLK